MVHVDIVYLRHILDAISRIGEYLQGINEEEFVRNYLVQDGVIRQLEIIGEATKQISQGTREKHSNIPWKDMAGMRDKLIHDYFGVDVEQVWLTASNDIPTLKIEIEEVVNNLG
jgi:uncharacterized protein with HEPN domain